MQKRQLASSRLVLAVGLALAVTPLGAEEALFDDGFETGNTVFWSAVNSAPCVGSGDADLDRLDDCVESDSGHFVDATNTGTDPNDPDTDGDGLPDGDEVLGTLAGLDLPGLGVHPLVRNILFEYDWFDDQNDPGTCAAHSHRPTAGSVGRVTTAFAAGSGTNPDGSTGLIALHDYGQGGPFTGGNLIVDADGVLSQGVNSAEFDALKGAQFAANRKGYFHYVVLPHRYATNSGSSGQAELPGDDMIVSLYCYGSDGNVANTIVHEVGHNLNLRHGGYENCNDKPNYNSVMNYRYQFPGVDTNCTPPGDDLLDYSRGTRIDLDESDLDENAGTCGATPWDWDGDGTIEIGVQEDVNAADQFQSSNCGGKFTLLRDSDDWALLDLAAFVASSDGAPLFDQREIVDCDNPPPWPG